MLLLCGHFWSNTETDGARAEGNAGIPLVLQAQVAVLQQQCSKAYLLVLVGEC